MTMRGNRASSKRCRGEGYRFIAAPIAVPAGPVAQASAARIRPPSPARSSDARKRSHGCTAPGTPHATASAAVVWVAGEPGYRQDHADRTLRREPRRHRLRARPVRGALRHGRAVSPRPRSARGTVPQRQRRVPPLLRAVAPTWLLQLPWLSTAEERDALRRELAGVSPDRMLREMGESARSLHRAPAAAAGDRGPALERPCDDPAHRLHRAAARQRAPDVAVELPAAEVVALDHPLNPLRHELRLHGLCEEIVLDPFSEAEVADYVAERSPAIAGDEAFVRALHERTDGVPLFVASVMSEVIARAAQDGDDAAAAAQFADLAVPENLTASSIITSPGSGTSSAPCCPRPPSAVSSFASAPFPTSLERDAARSARPASELAREQLWLDAPRAERSAMSPSRRTRSAMRSSVRCCTNAPRQRLARSSTAR